LHIPYKGANEAQIDVATGLVDFFFANLPSALAMVNQGRLKVLAVTSSKRVRQFPNVPTMAEAGVSDFNITSWLGVYGPAGMPKAIVDQLSADIVAGVSQGEPRTRLENVGFEVNPMRSEQWDRFNKEELARWSDIAKKAGISIEFGKG
ncbi:MAG TPA: tripartite tricarboxylate transporter substrate-binding protein, partial [Noviherbaspirillum sp.]|nr:tripartite tricarboxylate transporter substrate-binding protein [Noviherbaspirillum sp.]